MIRDKRGYETTYLIHSIREASRQRSRILYVFRTPAGVHGGRVALESEVRQNIEDSHPTIAFDWKAIIADRQVVDSNPSPRRVRKPRKAEEGRPGTRPSRSASSPTRARSPIPSKIDGATPTARVEFLALWYPIVCDRIPARISDPIRREALLVLAEQLNPIGWTDADEVATGLEGAAESLSHLSRALSNKRRRSRRSKSRPVDLPATTPQSVESTQKAKAVIVDASESKAASQSETE